MAVSVTEIRQHEPKWSFGDRLRKARKDAHISQKRMAELFDMSYGAISQWENVVSRPEKFQAAVRMWAETTNVSEAWLLGYTDPVNDPRDFQMEMSLAA
jgi:transcriptional regulator with XRE-family HTH domain